MDAQLIEELIEKHEFERAQQMLVAVEENSAEKYFLQGKLYKEKGWYSEARKQFKSALKEEPENEEYKKALDDLEGFKDGTKFRKAKQMGNSSEFAEACCLCGSECCGTLLCQAICEGCS